MKPYTPIYMTNKRIVIQGIEGSFHHIAAEQIFGKDIKLLPANSFPELINLTLDSKKSDYAIMAIENSIAGSILQNYGLLQNSGLYVIGEVFINIQQNLMALPGQTLEDIKEIHSHPMALQQCRFFLQNHMKGTLLVEDFDTSLSAKNIRNQMIMGQGAIASSLAARLFGLEILAKSIESLHNNQTRFFVIARQEEYPSNFNKSSIYFMTSHQPGSLSKVLQIIAEEGINLLKLQSFPSNTENWKYYFHADLKFENKLQYEDTIEKIIPHTEDLKILGKYKEGHSIRH